MTRACTTRSDAGQAHHSTTTEGTTTHMNTTQTRGTAFRVKQTARVGLTSAAAIAMLAGGVLSIAGPATAAPGLAGGGISPMAASTAAYADVFSNVKIDSADPVLADGTLLWKTAMAMSFDMKIPNDAAPGDTFALKLAESDRFMFQAFSGLEIKSADGTVIATAKSADGDRSAFVITLTDAVSVSQNITGSTTVTVKPIADKLEDKISTLTLMGADGTNLGPGTSYTIEPASTGVIVSPRIVNGNEVGLLVGGQYVKQSGFLTDLSGATAIIQANEPGLLPNCDMNVGIAWITDDGATTYASGYKTRVIDCNLETGTLTVGFPDGVVVPEGTIGYNLNTEWVADTPAKSYTLDGDISAEGQTIAKTGKGTSPSLAGAADGVVRPAQTTVSKTSDAPDRLLVGMEVVYTITTKNLEELRTAYGIKTVDTLPAGTEFVSASEGGTFKDGDVVWAASDYAPGQEKNVRVRVKVLDTAADLITNKVRNTGVNTCFAGDDTGSVCEASVSDTLTRVSLEFDKQELGVEDVNGNGVSGDRDDMIKYGFSVTNTGNAPESVITLTDKLLGIDGQEIILDTALQPGESIMLPGEYFYTITEADEAAGSVVNEATVSVPDGTPIGDSVETPVTPAPVPTPTATPTATPTSTPVPVKTVDLAKTGADQFGLWAGILGGITVLGAGALALVRRNRTATPVESTPSE